MIEPIKTDKRTVYEVISYMDRISDIEALPVAMRIAEDNKNAELCTECYISEAKYYLAVKYLMKQQENKEYPVSCNELYRLGLPQSRNFVPCIVHPLLEKEGIACGCSEKSCRLNLSLRKLETA